MDRRAPGESDRRLLIRVAKRVGIGTALLVGFFAVFAVSGWSVPPAMFIAAAALPTVWMQERWYRFGSPSVLDLYGTVIHFGYFVVPHLFALLVWRKRPALARRYIAAARPARLPGDGGRPHGDEPRHVRHGYGVAGTNPVAAMPSLHFGIAVLIARTAAEIAPRAAGAGVAYVVSMGLVDVRGRALRGRSSGQRRARGGRVAVCSRIGPG